MTINVRDLALALQVTPKALQKDAREATACVVTQHQAKPVHTQHSAGIRLEATETDVSALSEEAVSTLAPRYLQDKGGKEFKEMIDELRVYVNDRLSASTDAANTQAEVAKSNEEGAALPPSHSEEPLKIRPNGEVHRTGELLERDRSQADSPAHVWFDRPGQDTEKVARRFQEEANRRP